MRTNKKLIKAQKEKKNEFYTKYETIEAEIPYYSQYIKNKNIYCCCDDPKKSAFWLYFRDNFDVFGLKSLTATYYDTEKPVYKTVLRKNGHGSFDTQRTLLNGNGDCMSEEVRDILRSPDTVVITNPPFSLAKDFISLMYELSVPYLILGNQNALTFRNVYPRLLSGELFFGVSIHSGDVEFEVPQQYNLTGLNTREISGKKYARVTGIRWLTNMDHGNYPEKIDLRSMSWNLKNNERLIKKLAADYGTKEYPMYENYPAIEVPFSSAIPSDFFGTIGVPITFVDKYNPQQFRFVGFRKGDDGKDLRVKNKTPYFRLLVQRVNI